MRHVFVYLPLAACITLASCKRHAPLRDIQAVERSAATQPTTTQPATAPATMPADATLTDEQLLHFTAVTRSVIGALSSADARVVRSPEDFSLFALSIRERIEMKPIFAGSGMSFDGWSSIGTHAWAAWSVAQVDFNTEAPLRENAARESEARERLASAQATLKAGARIMSPEERSRFVTAAHDAAVNANDRAAMWADKSARLREQVAAANDLPPIDPDAGPAARAARASAADAATIARSAMEQELAAAERNEQQAREDARRAEASARDPQSPVDDVEKAEILRKALASIEQATAEIARCHDEGALLRTRLSEDRRVNADARRKAASEWDIAILRKRLSEFNDAWGMTIEGRIR